jgi:hypothetical protein
MQHLVLLTDLAFKQSGHNGLVADRNFRMADNTETCYRPTTADHNTDLALRND